MEDLYDDLDNYEDVHALEELRAENKELKMKLENRSAAMEKLQKEILQDYDNLEIAFKQLENNYSSLLKTARSEIQRKTERITQLNTEKDMMVLDALKSGRHIRRNIKVGVNHPGKVDQVKPVKKKTKNKEVKQKNVDIKQERREPPVLPTKDAGSDSSTYNSNKSSKASVVKLELSDNRKSNINDNVPQHKTELNESPRTTASSIKNRRKSMPVSSMPTDTFSSGDEQERNYPTKEIGTNNERRNSNKMPVDRPSNKTCETSSVDDKTLKQHESSSRDNYKSRTSRNQDSNSYKGRDKYEVSLKYRKLHSPERGLKRPHMEHQDEYPKQHRDLQDDYPKKCREIQDDYCRKSREKQDDYLRQPREHQDDYPRQHREYQDDYARKPREHADDYTRKLREHPDDYTRKLREHPDDYNRRPREHLDDYTRRPREHPDDHPRQSRENPADYPRQSRENPADYPRHERGRYQGRSLESPPPESHNRRQRTKSAHRSDYDRYPHDQEKNRHYHDDKYLTKYRSKDYEEPVSKRQRTDSYGNHDTHSTDDKRHYRERRDSVDPQPTPDFSPHEYDMLRFSCQSPDSVHTDGAIANPIKEIMATAATPLDDPRLTSKRYCIRTENGNETISTVLGRNIDIKPVDKKAWNIQPVDIPVALVRRPSQCSDQLVKDIYMDIDNPVTNLDLSMESGEVCGTDDEMYETRSKLKEIQHNTQDFKISKQASEGISKQPVNDQIVSKPNIAKYRIPKIGQINKNVQSKKDVPIIDVAENVPHYKKVNKREVSEEIFQKELLTHKQQNNKREDFSNNKNVSKIDGNKKSKSRDRSENQNQSTLTKMAIVADDLELSDDNSDHVDTDKRVIPEKVKKINSEIPLNTNEGKSNNSVNNVQDNRVVSTHDTEIKSTADTAEIKDVAEEEKTKESDSTKKQKTKKKKSKSKDSVETTADPIHVIEKKPKSKKEKESTPRETKDRFSDLFGDSSSLMTPEDLGIPSYLPISEDAQDAVDMKINQIIDAAPIADKLPGNVVSHNGIEVTVQETAVYDDIPKADLEKSNTVAEDKDIKTKSSSSRNVEIIDTNQLPSPIVYENLNPGTDLNDPNVVKTVIISTGKQPEIAYDSKIEESKPTVAVQVNAVGNTEDTHHVATKTEIKKDVLKALATSTPHKDFAMNQEANAIKTNDICDPSVSNAVATITNLEPVVNQNENNALESNDAPDVRIFVKRRRKLVKRPPMT
ncbi:hypothetical protein PYW08_014929 [Mythimna loreyi]|uniref:Uncharacterized protein n=1 Tax=Mythimna loreyi TaxID=667449 RepID=A0ACC2R8N9_9NEOP|nr:hypothetical protein PYW08_014929 [Mythimna loreyi]